MPSDEDAFYADIQRKLADKHEREWKAKWEVFRKAHPMVHDDAVAKYNKLAAATRKDNPTEGVVRPLAKDELGLTAVRYPDAPNLAKMPNDRPQPRMGPHPYEWQPPQIAVAIKPGAEAKAKPHEDLHVQMASADGRKELGDDWDKLTPRERALYRVYKALENENAPHARHEALGIDAGYHAPLLAGLKANR